MTRRQLHIPFFKFVNNKHLRSKWFFFLSKNHIFCIFFLCCMFLLERDQILTKLYVMVSATKFPTKWYPFQPPRSKTVGGDTFGVAKSVLFRSVLLYSECPHRQGGCLACCGCTFDSAQVHWFILCTRHSGDTAHDGGGCNQSTGSTVSDAIVRSWL